MGLGLVVSVVIVVAKGTRGHYVACVGSCDVEAAAFHSPSLVDQVSCSDSWESCVDFVDMESERPARVVEVEVSGHHSVPLASALVLEGCCGYRGYSRCDSAAVLVIVELNAFPIPDAALVLQVDHSGPGSHLEALHRLVRAAWRWQAR